MFDIFPFTPVRPFNSEEGRRQLATLPPSMLELLRELEPALLRRAHVSPERADAAWGGNFVLEVAIALDEAGDPIWERFYSNLPLRTALALANLLAWAQAEFAGIPLEAITSGKLRNSQRMAA